MNGRTQMRVLIDCALSSSFNRPTAMAEPVMVIPVKTSPVIFCVTGKIPTRSDVHPPVKVFMIAAWLIGSDIHQRSFRAGIQAETEYAYQPLGVSQVTALVIRSIHPPDAYPNLVRIEIIREAIHLQVCACGRSGKSVPYGAKILIRTRYCPAQITLVFA